jgi:hypothetical protein
VKKTRIFNFIFPITNAPLGLAFRWIANFCDHSVASGINIIRLRKIMHNQIAMGVSLIMTCGVASAQIVERTEPVALDSPYVTVNLNRLANNQGPLEAPGGPVRFENIPLDLTPNGANNNLFLEKAGWPDWAKDSLEFYADYDVTPKEPTDTLPVVQIPTDDYSAVYVLASCENDVKYSNVLSLRIGAKKGFQQTTYRDYEFEIPRANQPTGPGVIKVLSGEKGNIFLIRLPLNATFSQDFSNHRALDVEITKKIRLSVSKPDAARFQYRPLGLPSGVHIYGMTFERAPLRFSLQAAQVGAVFNEPEAPAFNLHLKPVENSQIKTLTVRAKATDYYGTTQEFKTEEMVIGPLASFTEFDRTLSLPVRRRGYYVLDVTVESEGKVLLTRQTTFALLPKDTRQHRDKSPFGTWDFGGTHYTPGDSAMVGPLHVKAGLRYGMFALSQADRERYGVLKGSDYTTHTEANLETLDADIAKIKASGEIPARWMLFHEDVISGNHVTRTPSTFSGKPYTFNAEEQKKFDSMVNIIRQAVPKIRKAFPGIQIHLGNGVPHLMEEFLKHKLSPELFDVLGNEAASFQRLPESQPTDFVANNPSLWMQNEYLKYYDYKDKSVEQAYEIMYPSTNPGNVTLREQANYTVRNIMHSLAWKVPLIRFGSITDQGNSYYHSNWGGVGLMFARPDISPKPLYVATATLTQLLDGAKFTRIVPTGATTVYAFEFKKPDGGFVTCLWTPTAKQHVAVQTSQSSLVVTDLMSNSQTLPAKEGTVALVAGADPVFIESARGLKVVAGATIESLSAPGATLGGNIVVAALDDAAQLNVDSGEDDELQSYNFMQPRHAQPFEVKNSTEFGGLKNVLQVKPLQTEDKQWWLPGYAQLKFKNPLEIQGKPTHIGLMVNGNGGWGQIIFEFEDAAEQRWISLGSEQGGEPNPWLADWLSKDEFSRLKSSGVSDWNSNDIWGRSMINFTGWRYLQFPMPGNYPGEGYHWPYTSQWRCVKADNAPGDYIVHYPLKATKLAVTSRSKVLYGNQVLPVQRPEIYLKNLSVSYGNPDKVFWIPDPGQN